MKKLFVLALVAAAASTVACEGKKDNKKSAPVTEQQTQEAPKTGEQKVGDLAADQKVDSADAGTASGGAETAVDQKPGIDQPQEPIAPSVPADEKGTVIEKGDGDITDCTIIDGTSKSGLKDNSKLLKAEECKSNVIEGEVIDNTQPSKSN
jgi:hypothetical protein